MTGIPKTCFQLQSVVTKDGTLTLGVNDIDVPQPKDHEVLVQVEATPINPSDLLILTALNDFQDAENVGSEVYPAMKIKLKPEQISSLASRIGQTMIAGAECSGTVVAAGKNPQAQALLGKKVSCIGGDMHVQYRCLPASLVMPLPEHVEFKDGASSFVNPLTALSFVETMKEEGHTGLIMAAAASNLGQMLNRLCLHEDIPLVSIVRKPSQEKVLRDLGAKYVVNSSSSDFMQNLCAAVRETGATLGFDPIGGGPVAGQILTAIEQVSSEGKEYNRYGSNVNNQVYICGRLDRRPIEVPVGVGLSWKMGGFLLLNFLDKIGKDRRVELTQKVHQHLNTIFASHYSEEISLKDVLKKENLKRISSLTTGDKFLIRPSL